MVAVPLVMLIGPNATGEPPFILKVPLAISQDAGTLANAIGIETGAPEQLVAPPEMVAVGQVMTNVFVGKVGIEFPGEHPAGTGLNRGLILNVVLHAASGTV